MKFGNEQDVRTLTVLGRAAVLSSDHTMKIEISLGSGANGGTGGPVEQGPLARTLTVALDRKDRGGYYGITVWSESGALPDDGRLTAIAEKIIPTIPERPARQGGRGNSQSRQETSRAHPKTMSTATAMGHAAQQRLLSVQLPVALPVVGSAPRPLPTVPFRPS